MKFREFINGSWRQTIGIIILYFFFAKVSDLKPLWDFGIVINLIIGILSFVIALIIGKVIIWFFYGKKLESKVENKTSSREKEKWIKKETLLKE